MNYTFTAKRQIEKYIQNVSLYVADIGPQLTGVVPTLGEIINLLLGLDSDTWVTKTIWSVPSIIETYSDKQNNTMDLISGDFQVTFEINRFPKTAMFHLEPTAKDNFVQAIKNKLSLLNVSVVAQMNKVYITQANLVATSATSETTAAASVTDDESTTEPNTISIEDNTMVDTESSTDNIINTLTN